MLFSKRCVLALKAIRWCEEHNVQPTAFNIVTAVDSFGLLKGEAVEQGVHPTLGIRAAFQAFVYAVKSSVLTAFRRPPQRG